MALRQQSPEADYESSREVDVDCDPAELQLLAELQQVADDNERIAGLIKVQRTTLKTTEKGLKTGALKD